MGQEVPVGTGLVVIEEAALVGRTGGTPVAEGVVAIEVALVELEEPGGRAQLRDEQTRSVAQHPPPMPMGQA